MKRFLKKILIFFLIFLACYLLIIPFNIFVIGDQYRGTYTASLDDKLQRLDEIEGPKIILVGDSNLVFGINSEMIEKETGMPVVNMGFHAGLGNAFVERVIYEHISQGDIVIFSQLSFSDDDTVLDNNLAWVTLEYDFDKWYILRDKDYPRFLMSYPAYAFDSFWLFVTHSGNKPNDNQYSRDAFNQYGDVVRKPESSRLDPDILFQENSIRVPEINDTCIDRLNSWNRYISSCGATMAVTACPVPSGEYTPPADEYRRFQERLADRLDCDLISDYTDYFIPYRYFYDTQVHLDNEGADLRTIQLIDDIKRWRDDM